MAKAARAPTVKRKPQAPGPQTRLVKPKSKRARRILEAREPKLVRSFAWSGCCIKQSSSASYQVVRTLRLYVLAHPRFQRISPVIQHS